MYCKLCLKGVNTMEYKRFGQKIILRLNPGEEVTECIREVCRTEKVALGEVSGLGAA